MQGILQQVIIEILVYMEHEVKGEFLQLRKSLDSYVYLLDIAIIVFCHDEVGTITA